MTRHCKCPVKHPLSCLWILVEKQTSRNSVLCVIKYTEINCSNKTLSITAVSPSNSIICNTAI